MIKATGGALVPDKSYWYLLDFEWKRGEWRYATEDETPAEIMVNDMDGTQACADSASSVRS